jgi:hypothetical protein
VHTLQYNGTLDERVLNVLQFILPTVYFVFAKCKLNFPDKAPSGAKHIGEILNHLNVFPAIAYFIVSLIVTEAKVLSVYTWRRFER